MIVHFCSSSDIPILSNGLGPTFRQLEVPCVFILVSYAGKLDLKEELDRERAAGVWNVLLKKIR